MIKTLRLVAGRGAIVAGAIVISASAFAQAPTDAQREAIRSACRSDYIAHCSSVPPGGLESLQCLQKNMSSLSGSCKSAVNAVEAPAAAPAAKSETPAAAPAAETPARSRACQAGDRRGSGSRSQSHTGCDRQKTHRCADRGDPQRLPIRLPKSLRRRADRRRARAAMPG